MICSVDASSRDFPLPCCHVSKCFARCVVLLVMRVKCLLCAFFEHGRTLVESVALESRYRSNVSLNLIERISTKDLACFLECPCFFPMFILTLPTQHLIFREILQVLNEPLCRPYMFLSCVPFCGSCAKSPCWLVMLTKVGSCSIVSPTQASKVLLFAKVSGTVYAFVPFRFD